MKVVISPAKKLDFETEAIVNETTCPQLMEKTHPLIKKLKTLSSDDIAKLMKLSSTLQITSTIAFPIPKIFILSFFCFYW